MTTATKPAQQIAKLNANNVAGFLFSEPIKAQIALALPQHLKPERMIRMALTTVRRTPKLLECDPLTLVACIVQASELGLELSGPLGQAYMIPRKNHGKMEATFQIGYRGFLRLAHNTGQVAYFNARAVRHGDYFAYSLGTSQTIEHRREASPGAAITHFYAVLKQTNGAADCEVWSVSDMIVHRDRYRSDKFLKEKDKSYQGPWDTDFEAMGCKTMIRELSKRAPLSAELMSMASRDEYMEVGAPTPIAPFEFDSIEAAAPAEIDGPASPPAPPALPDNRITDAQAAELNAAIVTNEASIRLIRDRYGLANGERLLAGEFAGCMAKVAAGEFTPKQEAKAKLPDAGAAPAMVSDGVLDEIEAEFQRLGTTPPTIKSMIGKYGVPDAASLTAANAASLLAELRKIESREAGSDG